VRKAAYITLSESLKMITLSAVKDEKPALGGTHTAFQVSRLCELKWNLRELPVHLQEYLQHVARWIGSVAHLTINVHTSVSGIHDHGSKWIKPGCVCADEYHESKRARHDDVIIKCGDQIIFGKLLLLFGIKLDVWHELCYIQRYTSAINTAAHSAFGEPYIISSNNREIHPVSSIEGSCYLIEDPATDPRSPVYFVHTGVLDSDTWQDSFDVQWSEAQEQERLRVEEAARQKRSESSL